MRVQVGDASQALALRNVVNGHQSNEAENSLWILAQNGVDLLLGQTSLPHHRHHVIQDVGITPSSVTHPRRLAANIL